MFFPLFSFTPNSMAVDENDQISCDSLTLNSLAPISLTPHSMARKSYFLHLEPPDPTAEEPKAVRDFTELALEVLPFGPWLSWEDWAVVFPNSVIPYTLAPRESWKFIPVEGQLCKDLTSPSATSTSGQVVPFQPAIPGMMTINVMLRTRALQSRTAEFIPSTSKHASLTVSQRSFDGTVRERVFMSMTKMVHGNRVEAFTFNLAPSKKQPISETRLGNFRIVKAESESLPRRQLEWRLPYRQDQSHSAFPPRSKYDSRWEPLHSPYQDYDDSDSFASGIRNRVPLNPVSQHNPFSDLPPPHLTAAPIFPSSPLRPFISLPGPESRRLSERPFTISPIGVRKPDFRALTKNARKGVLTILKQQPLKRKRTPRMVVEPLQPVKPKRPRDLLQTYGAIDLDLIKPKTEIPWYVIRELRPHFIGPRRFLPDMKSVDLAVSIKAERAVVHQAILRELWATVNRVAHKRKGAITLGKISVPYVRKVKFPKILRNDDDLLPFIVIPTDAERQALETGIWRN
jgi:hypothetical protein